MKIVLINPPPRSEYERHWAKFPVLGLAYVASSLRAHGHNVSLLDGKLGGLSTAAILQKVRALSPDLVGITCMTVEFYQAAEIADAIKRTMAVPVVVGGAHVNAVGGLVLTEAQGVDFACVGE